MNNIKTWQELKQKHLERFPHSDCSDETHMDDEITNLRASLAERDGEIEQLRDGWKKVTHENGIVRAHNHNLRAAVQQALEALETCKENLPGTRFKSRDYHETKVGATKAALTAAMKGTTP